MKQHGTATKLLPWFVNGSLDESEHALVDTHLKICETCQADVQEMLYLSNLLSDRSIDWTSHIEEIGLPSVSSNCVS